MSIASLSVIDDKTIIDNIERNLKMAHPVNEVHPKVEHTLSIFVKQWTNTAELCIKRAEELEKAADELRHRASNLQTACSYIEDVRGAVSFEIESRHRADSLALVNPPKDG